MKILNRQIWSMSAGLLGLALVANAVAQTKVLPDPTRPPVVNSTESIATSAAEGQLSTVAKLTAVFIQPNNRTAVINNDIVVEGQVWNGMQILEIHPQKVVLTSENGIQELLLNDLNIKKEAYNEL
ncbi:hypothetical protein EYS14_23990 [Alteromonadaceae bacterium M269]|nr:hypothetical protein EYS14_23990 [Alteromonadaceae bacterium M269]